MGTGTVEVLAEISSGYVPGGTVLATSEPVYVTWNPPSLVHATEGAAASRGRRGATGATTDVDEYCWTNAPLGPGQHTVSITSLGDSSNVYGVWVASTLAHRVPPPVPPPRRHETVRATRSYHNPVVIRTQDDTRRHQVARSSALLKTARAANPSGVRIPLPPQKVPCNTRNFWLPAPGIVWALRRA